MRLNLNISSLVKSFVSVSIFLSVNSYADDHHLFPSDIIDQAERASYDEEREARYHSQRQWTFPNESEIMSTNTPASQQYITIDGQPLQNYPQPSRQGTTRYPESDRYKYSDFTQKPGVNYWSDKRFDYSQPSSRETFGSSISEMGKANYPDESLFKPQNGNTSYRTTPSYNPGSYPQTQYVPQPVDPYSSSTYSDVLNSRGAHSDVLFPSDVEPSRKPYRNRYEPFSEQGDLTGRPNQTKEQIRYVPVPVYNVPGTLPGTVPGMITPSHMVPGYSHLNPYGSNQVFNTAPFNHYGVNNLWGTPYNPFSTFNGFPGIGGPFNNFYSNDGTMFNTWPFSNPGLLMPGLSVPDSYR